MALKRVTFIGNPDNPADRPPFAEPYGQRFLLDRPRDVELSDFVIGKLAANRHFLVEDVSDAGPDQAAAPAVTQAGEAPASLRSPAADATAASSPSKAPPPPPPVEVAAPPSDTASEPPPIEIRRERARSKRNS